MEEYKNICEYISNNEYSVIVDFLSTVLGAFLGFIVALAIYVLSENNRRKKEKNDEKRNSYNTLIRLSLILKSVISTSTKQGKEFNAISEKLLSHPLVIHLPEIPVSNDVNRLVASDDLMLYKAFMLFKNNDKDRHNDYKNIFKHADYLQAYFADLLTQNEKHQLYVHSQLLVVKDNLFQIASKLSFLLTDIELKEPTNYKSNTTHIFIENFFKIYVDIRGSGFPDFSRYKVEFFNPLLEKLYTYISNITIADEIALTISKSIIILTEVELNSKKQAGDFSNSKDKEFVDGAILFLTKMSAWIDSIKES